MTYFGKGWVLEAVGINLKFWTFAGGRVYQNKCKQEGGVQILIVLWELNSWIPPCVEKKAIKLSVKQTFGPFLGYK